MCFRKLFKPVNFVEYVKDRNEVLLKVKIESFEVLQKKLK